MKIYEINPTSDARWDNFVAGHPSSSVFHTRGWLQALQDTYGYVPMAFTTSAPDDELTGAIPACEIVGWLGRRRLVSLPFSDHCALLTSNQAQRGQLLDYLRAAVDGGRYTHVELRDAGEDALEDRAFVACGKFAFHTLDLRPELSTILHNCHADCIQRKIRRAERDGVSVESGNSAALLEQFYQLVLKTRRRHGLPAQPVEWFRNILRRLSEQAKVWIASQDGQPITGIFTLQHQQTLTYKYGCSDRKFSSLGGTQLLFWKAIEEAKRSGLLEMDMGRSDLDNPGLIQFKDRWNAVRTSIRYHRYPEKKAARKSSHGSVGKQVWSHAPERVIEAAGRILYRYMG